MKKAIICISIFAPLFAGHPIYADVMSVPVTVQGMINSFGFNNGSYNAGAGNIITGQASGITFHSYFLFDLSTLTSNVSAASFVITAPYGSYISSDSFETFSLFDVSSSSFAALQDQYTTWNFTVYNDLASGTTYGSYNISSADSNTTITVTLNADAIAAINAAKGGNFAIGGALTTITELERIFAFSDYRTNTKLQLTLVPEPSTMVLLGVGSWLLRRRHGR